MGASHSVYMANASGKKIWVMVALKPEWMLVDVFVDIGLLLVAAGELKLLVEGAELPATLHTVGDLFKFMTVAVKLLWASIGAATRPADAVISMLDAFKGLASASIEPGDVQDVNDESWLNYLNADGIASLFGVKTLNVMVLSDDGHQFAFYGTNNDHSWIATDDDRIVRSKYGTLWQQDPGAGSIDWPSPPPPPRPSLPTMKNCECHHSGLYEIVACSCGASDCSCGRPRF